MSEQSFNPLTLKGRSSAVSRRGSDRFLMERVVYDDSGQLVTASFMDYAIATADVLAISRSEQSGARRG